MYMEKFLDTIGIKQTGHYDYNNGRKDYIIDIKDSDEYGKIYSKLDHSNLVEENDNLSNINMNNSHVVFESPEYQFTLIADFEQDTYKLVCKQLKEN